MKTIGTPLNSARSTKFILLYYLALAIVLFLLMRPETELPMYIRIPLFALIVAPAFIDRSVLPAALVLFYGANTSSFAVVLPTVEEYYLFIVAVVFLINYKAGPLLPRKLIVLLYFALLSLLHFDIRSVILWGLVAIFLSELIENKSDLSLLFYAFIALSILLSLLFIVHRGEFSVQYGTNDLERTLWINPNVLGASIGAGGVLASAYLANTLKLVKTRVATILSCATVILVLVALSLNASRGSLLAFALPSLFMLLLSRNKLFFKIIIVVLSIALIVWLFKSGSLDLLLYRIESDATGDGTRSEIWQTKLGAFFSGETGFLELLFGIGQTKCSELGVAKSTHNDFVTAIIAYGFVGFAIFLYSIFIYPVKVAGKKNRLNILGLSSYLFIECMVLEPIFRGYFVEIMFFIFVLKYAQLMEEESKVHYLKVA